jgi:hypothetical protein
VTTNGVNEPLPGDSNRDVPVPSSAPRRRRGRRASHIPTPTSDAPPTTGLVVDKAVAGAARAAPKKTPQQSGVMAGGGNPHPNKRPQAATSSITSFRRGVPVPGGGDRDVKRPIGTAEPFGKNRQTEAVPMPRIDKPPVDQRDYEDRHDTRATSSDQALQRYIRLGWHRTFQRLMWWLRWESPWRSLAIATR